MLKSGTNETFKLSDWKAMQYKKRMVYLCKAFRLGIVNARAWVKIPWKTINICSKRAQKM